MTATKVAFRLLKMKGRCAGRKVVSLIHVAALVLLFMCVTGIAKAQAEQGDIPLIDHFEIKLGGYFTSLDTNLRLDLNSEETGTLINFEDDLDLDKRQTIYRLSAAMLFKKRHQVRLGYYQLDRSSSSRIEEEIDWGDETFPVNADVDAFFNLYFIEISYTYWALAREKTALGVALGLVSVGVESGIVLVGEREHGIGIDTDLKTDVPVPLIGVQVRHAIIPKLILMGKGDFIYVNSLGDYSGSVLFIGGGLEYRAFKYMGFGLTYDYGHLDVEARSNLFTGEIDYTMQGLQGYLRFNF
jgi:hypothetical protein